MGAQILLDLPVLCPHNLGLILLTPMPYPFKLPGQGPCVTGKAALSCRPRPGGSRDKGREHPVFKARPQEGGDPGVSV